MLNSKAIRCSTPSATCSTCSTWTLCSVAHDKLYPEWAAKKVDSWQVETPSRVGKSRCYSCFLMFFSCIGEWLQDARCFHPVLPSNKEIAHVCSGYASSFPAWMRTCHDLPTAVFFGGAKSKGQNQYVEAVGSSSSVPLGRNGFDFRCLFELLVHLNPLQQGALRTGDSPDAYRNPSTWLCRTQVGHVAQVQTYEIPNSRPLSQKFTEASRLQQPSLPLSDPQAVQINGATTLLLQADMGWDKWHCSWSLCVVTAEPPWNSVYSIWCPSPLSALHMFLLKDLIILEPNSSKF